jgi:hypothetical protein
VICDCHCGIFDELSGGALKRFLWLSNLPKSERTQVLTGEELDEEEERVDEIMSNMCDACHLYANEVLMENRYDSFNGVYLAMLGALFMVLDNVLTGGARLVLAFGRDKSSIQVAFDVFENGFPIEWESNYQAHFPTPKLLEEAREGFSRMACTNIATDLRKLPWRKNLSYVTKFLGDAKRNGVSLLGGGPHLCRYDLAAIRTLRAACEERQRTTEFATRKRKLLH